MARAEGLAGRRRQPYCLRGFSRRALAAVAHVDGALGLPMGHWNPTSTNLVVPTHRLGESTGQGAGRGSESSLPPATAAPLNPLRWNVERRERSELHAGCG